MVTTRSAAASAVKPRGGDAAAMIGNGGATASPRSGSGSGSGARSPSRGRRRAEPAPAGDAAAAAGEGGAGGKGGEDVLAAWAAQYPMPDEQAGHASVAARPLYTPPRNDAVGLSVAAAVIGAWALLFWHAMWGIRLEPGPRRSPWWDIIGTFFALEFASAGLFITTHDAMHGTVCFRSRRLNDAVGRLAISLYAWFDYDLLHRKHWEHHGHTGRPRADPDFHTGNPALLPWFARFMWAYSTPQQFARIVAWTAVLQALGAPYWNLVAYLAGAPILAAFRLFYFGTYLPHLPRDGGEVMPWQRSHSCDAGPLVAFLQCYCFGYHFEHHRWPYAPWWDLPRCKAVMRRLEREGAWARPPPGRQVLLWAS